MLKDYIKTETEIIPIDNIKLIQKKWFFGKCIDIHLKSAPFDPLKVITIWKFSEPRVYKQLLQYWEEKE